MRKTLLQKFSGCTAAAVLLTGTATILPEGIAPLLPTVSAVAATAAVTPSATQITTSATHNFTTDGLSSSYFDISGNLSDSKGTVTYNGMTLTQCLKMESATTLTFSTGSATTLTLVIKDGTTVQIDSTKYDIPSNNVLTVSLAAGSHSILKGSGSSNLYYISVSGGDGSSTVVTTTADPGSGSITTTSGGSGSMTQGEFKLINSGGWNEMLYATVSGVSDSQVTGVSYSGAASGKLTGNDLTYLVRVPIR